jgi:peptide/nickel transport system permease protein
MIKYAMRRTGLGAIVVAGVIILTFLLMRVIPADPAVTYAGPHASPQALARVRRELGLGSPLWVQIGDYFKGIFAGNWGISLRTHQPVTSDIATVLPASLELVIAGLGIAIALGVPVGIASARWKGRAPDMLGRFAAVLGTSMPVFWLALILQLVFFRKLGWLPAAGEYDPNSYYTSPLASHTNMPVVDALITGNWPVFKSALSHLILPALAVAAYPAGLVARMVRASLLDQVGQDHVRMVLSLGFGQRSVFGWYGLKPALNPVVQVIALVFAYSLANTFLVEQVFGWSGLGSYAANAIQSLDTTAIVGVTLVVAIAYVILNLLVDLVQAGLDPRISVR